MSSEESEESLPLFSPTSPRSQAAAGTSTDFSDSSGLAVGPHANDDRSAPFVPGNSTPPTNHFEGERSDISCNTTNMPFLSFTAKTCIELVSILTNDQVEFEYNVFKKLGGENPSTTRTMTISRKRDFIKKQLIKNLSSEFENIVNNVCLPLNFQPQTQSLFPRESENPTYVTGLTTRPAPAPVPAAAATPRTRENLRISLDQDSLDTGNPPLIEPVRFYNDLSFADIGIEETVKAFTYKKEGARKVAYFGTIEYKYGKTTHTPQPYPQSAFFDNVFSTLNAIDSSFTTENYSCMVNLYEN